MENNYVHWTEMTTKTPEEKVERKRLIQKYDEEQKGKGFEKDKEEALSHLKSTNIVPDENEIQEIDQHINTNKKHFQELEDETTRQQSQIENEIEELDRVF